VRSSRSTSNIVTPNDRPRSDGKEKKQRNLHRRKVKERLSWRGHFVKSTRPTGAREGGEEGGRKTCVKKEGETIEVI